VTHRLVSGALSSSGGIIFFTTLVL
jgi:hypothetical protein